MDSIDLNLNNYDLYDILNLFKLSIHFNKSELKQAYKQTLMTHPDKSKLDKKYFLFFSSAFKILKQVFDFNNRANACVASSTNVEFIDNKEHAAMAEKIKNKPHFNKWFNELFEKVKVYDAEHDSGYNEWFHSNKDINTTTIHTMSEMNEAFDIKKAQSRELILHSKIHDLGGHDGYTLSRSMPENYGSEIFSKLQFEDLKKAHTETVVPVTHEDFTNRRKFNTVDEMSRHRSQCEQIPSDIETQDTLKQMKLDEHSINVHNAFKMAKQCDAIKDANNKWWGSLRQLTNK